MTRIILPAQLFFFIGSVMSSRLQVRKIFIYQAFAPLIYNGGIILGRAASCTASSASPRSRMACWPACSSASALLNSFGAFRTGLRYRPIVGFRDPAFLEWLKLSLPLMIGVSLVMFDGFFLNYFASVREGGITLISNAKCLFNAPFNVIGPAAGAASLPFFASLFQQNRAHDFSASVARAVSRLFAVGMIVSAWMIALAPWLMDLFRGGKFNRADAAATTQLFVILAVTLAHLGGAGHLRARLLRRQRHQNACHHRHAHHRALRPDVLGALPRPRPAPASPSRRTSASSRRPRRSPSCCIASAWSRFAHLEFGELGRALLAALARLRRHRCRARTFCRRSPPTRETCSPSPPHPSPGPPPPLLTLLATGSKLPAQILRRR